MRPETTGADQDHRDTRFKPGQSGNPNGRPKGSRHRITLIAEQMVDGAAEEIVGKIIEHATQGDPTALKMLLDRILPARKERPTQFALPPINSASDLPTAFAAISSAVADGEITMTEGAEASRLLENYARAVEVTELAARMDALEKKVQK